MGASWQTPEQKSFIEDHLHSFTQHSTAGTAKAIFWPEFIDKWFEKWPLPDPVPELVEKAGSVEKAVKVDHIKKVEVSTVCIPASLDRTHLIPQQLKRVFKAAANDDATGGRRNLRLEGPVSRKLSEVQAYMTLYYDTRIRPTVVERWAEARLPNMDFSGGSPEIPEDQIAPEDSSLLKDQKIPLCFKTDVARELYEAEEEEIKAAVRSKRDPDVPVVTVHNAPEEIRQELVREYRK
jgi:hypothetical protein